MRTRHPRKKQNSAPAGAVKAYTQSRRTKTEMEAARREEAAKKVAADLVHSGHIQDLADIQELARQRDAMEQSTVGSLPQKYHRKTSVRAPSSDEAFEPPSNDGQEGNYLYHTLIGNTRPSV